MYIYCVRNEWRIIVLLPKGSIILWKLSSSHKFRRNKHIRSFRINCMRIVLCSYFMNCMRNKWQRCLKDWQLTKCVDNKWKILLFAKKIHHIPIAGFLMRWHLVLESSWYKVNGNASITNSFQLITLLRNLTYNSHIFFVHPIR